MAISAALSAELKRLTPREKAFLADHLWREAEGKFELTDAHAKELAIRHDSALKHPEQLKPVGDARKRLRK